MIARTSFGSDSRAIIAGVCREIAARADLPAWTVRLLFAVFFCLHWLLAVIAYAALAHFLRPAPRPARPAEAWASRRAQRETALRRAFRDLEKK